MNCNLPVYREAYKQFEGTPRNIWSVLWLLERYVNAAIAQLDRVRETVEQISDYHGTWLLDQILLDIHYYFICWDKTQNLLERLNEVYPDPKMERLWQGFRLVCRPFNDARNHLEHIDERLARNPNETGTIQGDVFVFADERFDISEAGLKVLTDMYEEVINILALRNRDGQPFSLEEYDRLPWKPSVSRELPGRRPNK